MERGERRGKERGERILVEGMPIQMYGETQFVDLQVRTIIIWLYAERREEFNDSGIIFIA